MERPKNLNEWGYRYVARLVTHGIDKEEAIKYWVQSLLWPNGKDLIALTIDYPEVAADFDIEYLCPSSEKETKNH